ncbi:MAG: GcrA family cell cycle regulator [Pararhodobacter sp.]
MSWTDERVEVLKKMWAEGKSASQIAKELGSVTRNAVIGKVHRLGLSSRTSSDSSSEAPATTAADAPATAAPATSAAESPRSRAAQAGGQGATRETQRAETRRAEAATQTAEPVIEVPTEAPAPASVVALPGRRPIVPAGQPLPPQPSAHEISPEALANVREVEKSARRLSLMELTERTCKWPIGDPATEEFWFCGLPVVAGKPYCEAHVSVAFQPMQSRRDRRR